MIHLVLALLTVWFSVSPVALSDAWRRGAHVTAEQAAAHLQPGHGPKGHKHGAAPGVAFEASPPGQHVAPVPPSAAPGSEYTSSAGDPDDLLIPYSFMWIASSDHASLASRDLPPLDPPPRL